MTVKLGDKTYGFLLVGITLLMLMVVLVPSTERRVPQSKDAGSIRRMNDLAQSLQDDLAEVRRENETLQQRIRDMEASR